MNERPAEDRTSKDESSNKGKDEADAHGKSKARITTQPALAAPREDVDIDSLLAKVLPGTLGLFIVDAGDLVLVERAEEVTLGRQTEDAGTLISVDLTPYGGAKLGVSRRHAAILISQDMYFMQDLGSTNGTWLNEARLPPHISRTLKNGDMIRLGQIRIHVVFHSPKSGQGSGGSEKTSSTTSSNAAQD